MYEYGMPTVMPLRIYSSSVFHDLPLSCVFLMECFKMEKFICNKSNYKDSENNTYEFVPKWSVVPDSPTTDNKM